MRHIGRLLVVLVLLWQLVIGRFEPSLLLSGLAMTGLLLFLSRMAVVDVKCDPLGLLLRRARLGPWLPVEMATPPRAMPQLLVAEQHRTRPSLIWVRPVHLSGGCSAK